LEKRKSDLSGEKHRIISEEKKWNKYRGNRKEENEKLENKIADMLKAGDQNKTKPNRIKSPFLMDKL
jgi:hypothetical protein